MICELPSSKLFWGGVAFATGSIFFVGSFAITLMLGSAKQSSAHPPVDSSQPSSSVAIAPAPVRQVFDDQPSSLQASNARLIAHGFAQQSVQKQVAQLSQPSVPTMRSAIPPVAGVSVPSASANLVRPQPSTSSRPTAVVIAPSVIPVADVALDVRVRIDQRSALAVGSDQAFALTDEQGQVLQEVESMQAVSIAADNGRLILNDFSLDRPVWLQPLAPDALVFVGDRWYRGVVQLIPQGNTVLAVNQLDLEQYLYSVVGSEMPSAWNFEALKAQAIAARSYALVHMGRPAHSWYHLSNTQRHQVYSGISSETDRATGAVVETGGWVLIDRRGEVVEAMYASIDRVVATAHRGFTSMSQTGAAQRADQGWSVDQILAYYYPRTGLGVLNLEGR